MLQVSHGPSKSFWPALCALAVGAVAAYSAVAWILQIQSISAPTSTAPVALSSNAANQTNPPVDGSAVAAALGAPKPADAEGSAKSNAGNALHQWTLLGVVAGASGKGSALLAVDGQPPKAYLPGQTVAPGWVLHSVGHRLARLAPSQQDAPTVTLELPKTGN